MTRAGYICIGGEKYPLIMSMAALEEIQRRFGNLSKMIYRLSSDAEKKKNGNMTVALEMLISEGAAYADLVGDTRPEHIPDGKELGEWLTPRRLMMTQLAILTAINNGIERYIPDDDDEPADEEPDQKKASAWCRYYARLLNITTREFLHMPVGEFYDLIACWRNQNVQRKSGGISDIADLP